jgi:molecular chaperone HscB
VSLKEDYFALFGVPRRLQLDAADLERRFRMLSRQCHPDYFHNAPPAERRASLERSSSLNDAYRTLRQPAARVAYLLGLEGFGLKQAADGEAKAPPALLEEVFALNEEIDAVRMLRAAGAPEPVWKARLERAREPIDARRAGHEADLEALSARWDAIADAPDPSVEREEVLRVLRDRLLERNYITNLLAGVERELTT